MSLWLSSVLVVLFASQQDQEPLGGRERAGQRVDGLMLVAEEVFQARVTDVLDGDSVLVQDGARAIRVQLHGVDAPELSQSFGGQAQAFLRQLVSGKTLTVRRNGTGNGGAIAELDVDGTDVSAALVSAGLAWQCSRHAETQDLAAAEKAARHARRGLWQDVAPTPPWTHRGAAGCWDDGGRR
jgi:endonuclease YncB( thermonuclease family)